MGIILTTVFNRSLHRELSRLDLSPAQTSAVNEERSKLAGADPAPEILGGKLASVRRAVDLSVLRGFRTVMGSASLLALLGALAAVLFLAPASRSSAYR